MILVHDDETPSNSDWDAYIAALAAKRNASVLVITDGSGPTAGQRAAMNRRVATNARAAVVTPSAVARGIVTVIAWFYPGVCAFAPADLGGALDYLSVPPSARAGVIEQIAEMRMQLSGASASWKGKSAELRRDAIDPMEIVVTRLSKLRENIDRTRR